MAARNWVKKILFVLLVLIVAGVVFSVWWSNRPKPGHVKDEPNLAGYDFSKFHAANEDYFQDMDRTKDGKLDLVAIARQMKMPDDALIRGRNTWIVWTAGNDRFWNHLVNVSYGAIDLLKIVSSNPKLKEFDVDKKGRFSRDHRWEYLGLVNDPCFEQATEPGKYGLWLDKRRADCQPDPFEDEKKYPGVKIGSRGTKVNGEDFPVGSMYGYETGIVGLRLFPNPDFDDAAAKDWAEHQKNDDYFNTPAYYNNKNLVRPYRVGMSCGFCHVGPNPINPPKDPDNPKWENLSSNVGAQYFWIERIFYWAGEKDNFVWQLFHTSLPGTLDTSFVSTDNINNPRTMNAVYLLKDRLENARRWGKETLANGEKNNKQFNDFIPNDPNSPLNYLNKYFEPPDTVWTPRVLKDGSDSVGAMGALNRVYLNIGTFSEEWLLHFNALVGGKQITPIEISVARENSGYFKETEAETPFTALFFLASTDAHHLEDAPGGKEYLKKDEALVPLGKTVFAERCARCHSSKQPTPPPDVPALALNEGQGCAGKNYLDCWEKYWKWTQTDDYKNKILQIVNAPDFLDHNYLSTELRVPVTLLQTNACSPLATNALGGNIWDNFSSQSYKDLPSVGNITWYQPYTGEPRTYQMPAGGRGYTRPPSLVSLWSTAPFLLNNSVGHFEESPSVEARLRSFEDSIHQMLWPDSRDKDDELANIPGKIQRTTDTSYLYIPIGYLPDALQPILKSHPEVITNGELKIGPIPKGTPVGLLTNINPLSESKDPAERLEHDKKLLDLAIKLAADLHKLGDHPSDAEAKKVFANAVDQMLELSKCPDLIVNRGHYFGTDKFTGGEKGLSDDEKKALIAFLKRF
jgi:cytochrome c5